MGQVFRRTIINAGIHKKANGCTVWLGYLVSTDSCLAQCLSGDSAAVLFENKLTSQQVFLFCGKQMCCCVSRSALKLLWWPLLYWFGPSNFVILSQSLFLSLVGMLPRLMGSVIATVEKRAWRAKSSETKTHNSVHNSRGRVHDWNQALRSH